MFPRFHDWMAKRILIEGKRADTPDYSLDRFIAGVDKLGKDVDSFVGQARKKEVDYDKEIDKKGKEIEDKNKEAEVKSEPKEKESQKPDGEKPDDITKSSPWKKLQHLAKERAEKKPSWKTKQSDPPKNN